MLDITKKIEKLLLKKDLDALKTFLKNLNEKDKRKINSKVWEHVFITYPELLEIFNYKGINGRNLTYYLDININILKYLPRDFYTKNLNNKDFAYLLEKNPQIFSLLPDKLAKKKKYIFIALKNGINLDNIDDNTFKLEEWQNLLTHNPYNIKYLSSSYISKNYSKLKHIILYNISKDIDILQYNNIKINNQISNTILKNYSENLYKYLDDYYIYEEIFEDMIENDNIKDLSKIPNILFYVRFDKYGNKNDRIESETYQIFYDLVSNNGLFLEFVPNNIQDENICHLAFEKNKDSIVYFDSIYQNKILWKKAVLNNIHLIREIPKQYLDEDLINYVVRKNGMLISFIPEEFLNFNILKIALEKNIESFNYIPKNKKDNKLVFFYNKLKDKLKENNEEINSNNIKKIFKEKKYEIPKYINYLYDNNNLNLITKKLILEIPEIFDYLPFSKRNEELIIFLIEKDKNFIKKLYFYEMTNNILFKIIDFDKKYFIKKFLPYFKNNKIIINYLKSSNEIKINKKEELYLF